MSIPRWVIPALVAGILVFAGVAAAAVRGGTYSGTAVFTLDGTHVTHPFSLSVKKGKIVRVAFVATGNCEDLDDTSGLSVVIPITKDTFDSSIGVDGDTIKLVGTFKGASVAGTMRGTLDASAVNKHCAVIPAKFSATRA